VLGNREVWHAVTNILEECVSPILRVEYNRSHMFSEMLLGTFAKLRKVTVSFAMSVRPSLCPQGTIWLLLEIFIWNSIIFMVKTVYQWYQSFYYRTNFFLLALQPPSGVVFYSRLAGFSLLACEVSCSHKTTRHSR